MVIFDAKRLNPEWTNGEFPGTTYGLSDNGWINTELFEAWMSEHFLQHAVSARPLLLLLDGHSTHYQPQILRLAKENDVIILCLPPHTTHKAQPLDCGVFGPLKAHWSHVCHAYLQQNPGRIITCFQFSSLFSQAWSAAVSTANIISGFHTCGVYQFNPCAISATPILNMKTTQEHLLPRQRHHHAMTRSAKRVLAMSPSNSVTELRVTWCLRHPLLRSQKSRSVGFGFTLRRVFMDDDYVRWLEIHHPESLPHSTPEDFTHFSSVSPAAQVASVVTENIPPVSPRIIKLQPWCNELSDSNDQDNSPSASCQTPAEFSPSTSRQIPAKVSPSTSCQTPAEVSPSTSRQAPAEVSPSTSRQAPAKVSPSTSRQAPAEVSPSTSRQAPAEVSPSLSGAKKSQTSLIKIREQPSPGCSCFQDNTSSSAADQCRRYGSGRRRNARKSLL